MRLAESTWPQARAYFQKNDLVIIGVGSIESHGRHLCLGTDTLVPEELLRRIESLRPELMIAPTIPYGNCDDLTGFPGAVSLGPDVLYAVLEKITGSLYNAGARRFAIVNGHGGNIATLDRIGVALYRRGACCALLNWWKNAGELNPAWAGGHGGGQETAAILAVGENLVDRDALSGQMLRNDMTERLPTTGFDFVDFEGVHVQIPRDVHHYAENGWIGPDDPADATAAWGEEMLQATAEFYARFLDRFRTVPLPQPHTLP